MLKINNTVISRNKLKSNKPVREYRNISTAYVRGLNFAINSKKFGREDIGKNTPDRK